MALASTASSTNDPGSRSRSRRSRAVSLPWPRSFSSARSSGVTARSMAPRISSCIGLHATTRGFPDVRWLPLRHHVSRQTSREGANDRRRGRRRPSGRSEAGSSGGLPAFDSRPWLRPFCPVGSLFVSPFLRSTARNVTQSPTAGFGRAPLCLGDGMTEHLRRVADIATGQHGVVTARQISATGMTAAELRRRIQSGVLQRVGSHTYRGLFRADFDPRRAGGRRTRLRPWCGRLRAVSRSTPTGLTDFASADRYT